MDRANNVLMNVFCRMSIVRCDLIRLRGRKIIYELRFLLEHCFNEENGRIRGIKYIYNNLYIL